MYIIVLPLISETTTKTNVMNIQIESLSSNQNGIEYTYSNNGGYESEIQKMSKDDFAKLLCEHSDGNYIFGDSITLKDDKQVTEDHFEDVTCIVKTFVDSMIANETDYCKDCLTKYISSLNKN